MGNDVCEPIRHVFIFPKRRVRTQELEAGQTAQCLRARTLPEEPELVPSTHMVIPKYVN